MATLEHIAIRRAEAEARIAKAAKAIARALGVDAPAIETAHPMSPFPAELGAALYAEGIATHLESIAAAVAAPKPEPTTTTTTTTTTPAPELPKVKEGG